MARFSHQTRSAGASLGGGWLAPSDHPRASDARRSLADRGSSNRSDCLPDDPLGRFLVLLARGRVSITRLARQLLRRLREHVRQDHHGRCPLRALSRSPHPAQRKTLLTCMSIRSAPRCRWSCRATRHSMPRRRPWSCTGPLRALALARRSSRSSWWGPASPHSRATP